MKAVGALLEQARKRLDLSREKLGARVGVSGNTIYRIETGQQVPGGQLLLELADVLRLDMNMVKRVGLDQMNLDDVDLPDPKLLTDEEYADLMESLDYVIRKFVKRRPTD